MQQTQQPNILPCLGVPNERYDVHNQNSAHLQVWKNPLVSAKVVVEKEMMDEFTKDPSIDLPVKVSPFLAMSRDGMAMGNFL